MKLIKIPSSLGGLGKANSSEQAPDRIVEKTKELWLSENGVLPLFDVDEVKIVKSNIAETNKAIFDKIGAAKSNFIALGGDHSITHSCFKAFAQNNPNAGIVVFDAHPDLMQSFDVPSHENFLRMLIEEGFVKKENVILVGTRNSDKEELNFIKQNKIKVFSMKEISAEGKESACDAIMSVAKDFGSLYLSIDIDAVDPAFAPGTGYPEAGGLTSRELLYFIQRIRLLKNFRAADIVEVNPAKDVNDMTSLLAAKIAVELC